MYFTHSKLTDVSCFIRLFKIDQDASNHKRLSLKLTEHNVRDTDLENPQGVYYNALSYMWGPPEPYFEIQINRQRFHLRENLFQFLSNLTTSEQQDTFWVDAISIDQGDVEERSAQVANMGKIFKSATNLLAWVGQPVLGVNELFFSPHMAASELMSHTEISFWLERPGDAEDPDRLHVTIDTLGVAMSHFARRAYWERLWIVQELGLGRCAVIACGPCRATLVELRELRYAIWHRGPSACEMVSNSHLQPKAIETRNTLRQLMCTYKTAGCTDPRDKVYSLRALALDVTEDTVRPDYSKRAADLYWEVLSLCGCDRDGHPWFHHDLLQVLEISLNDMIRYCEVQLRSTWCRTFLTQDCGQYLVVEDIVRDCHPPKRKNAEQKRKTSGPNSVTRFVTEDANWMSFAAVNDGDRVLPFRSPQMGQLFAAVLKSNDGRVCSASWAVEQTSNVRSGVESQKIFTPLEWLHANCPEFNLFKKTNRHQGADSLPCRLSPRQSFWVTTPPIIMAILILDGRPSSPLAVESFLAHRTSFKAEGSNASARSQ